MVRDFVMHSVMGRDFVMHSVMVRDFVMHSMMGRDFMMHSVMGRDLVISLLHVLKKNKPIEPSFKKLCVRFLCPCVSPVRNIELIEGIFF